MFKLPLIDVEGHPPQRSRWEGSNQCLLVDDFIRATFTRIAPGFMAARASRPIRLVVLRCPLTTDHHGTALLEERIETLSRRLNPAGSRMTASESPRGAGPRAPPGAAARCRGARRIPFPGRQAPRPARRTPAGARRHTRCSAPDRRAGKPLQLPHPHGSGPTAPRWPCRVGVASKISFDGHVGQVTPSASGAFGSPRRAKAPRLFIIASRQRQTARPVGRRVGDVREQRRSEVAEHERQVERMRRAVDVVERRRLLVPVEAVVPDLVLLRLQRVQHVVGGGDEEDAGSSSSVFALKPVTGVVTGR